MVLYWQGYILDYIGDNSVSKAKYLLLIRFNNHPIPTSAGLWAMYNTVYKIPFYAPPSKVS